MFPLYKLQHATNEEFLTLAVSYMNKKDEESFYSEPLTPKELKVVSMIKLGYKTEEIAKELNLSVHTIYNYHKHIRSKLGITNKKINLGRYLRKNIV